MFSFILLSKTFAYLVLKKKLTFFSSLELSLTIVVVNSISSYKNIRRFCPVLQKESSFWTNMSKIIIKEIEPRKIFSRTQWRFTCVFNDKMLEKRLMPHVKMQKLYIVGMIYPRFNSYGMKFS